MALLFVAIAPLHLATRAVTGGSPWPARFLRAVGWIVGLRPRVSGPRPGPHSLLVANHLSWLDILALGGSLRSAFVSKDDLGHGFIHWLADQNRTVYVNRGHRKGAKDQALAIARALERDRPVTIFPESTTGPGTHLLPFRSALLEAANFAARDVAILPVALDYGSARDEVAWYHEPGKDNLLRLLGRRGTLPVTIHVLPPLDRSLGRKALAQAAQKAIAGQLGFKSDAGSPIGGDK